MKWSRFIFSIAMLMAAATAAAEDYDHRIQRYRERWAALIPTQFVVQNAGNMGALSAGIGWNYGKHQQWETDLLVGFIPKHQSIRAKFQDGSIPLKDLLGLSIGLKFHSM